MAQSRYLQELHNIRQRYQEQSVYMDQVLAQLTVSIFELFRRCSMGVFFDEKFNMIR